MTRSTLYTGVLLAGLLACGEGTADPVIPAAIANVVEVIQGDGQTDTVGQQLPIPIRIQVLDTTTVPAGAGAGSFEPSAGPPVPVPGQAVNFVIVSGGGKFFSGNGPLGAAITDSLGRAQEIWYLGPTAGQQCMEARAVDQETGEPLTFAQVCATAVPGPMVTSGFTLDSARVFGDTTFLVPAFARDAFNNPLPVPALGNPDTLLVTPEGEGWRVAFRRGGLSRLAIGGDTLYLYAFDPRGPYRWVRHRADTTWSETGRLRKLPTPVLVNCPGGSSTDSLSGRLYAVDSLWAVRAVAGGAVDTLAFGSSSGSNTKGCSVLGAVLANPMRPQANSGGNAFWPIGTASTGSGPYDGFNATQLVAPFTYVNVNGPIVDTLWLGQP